MHYKTMTLGLIQSCPEPYRRLRTERRLPEFLDQEARELQASHHAWTDRLRRDRPGENTRVLTASALEHAVRELTDRLGLAGSLDGSGDR